MGSKLLFEELSFGIHERERLGLLGPNGAGKSTLLKILAREETPDLGEVSYRKGVHTAFVKQEDVFNENLSVESNATVILKSRGMDELDAQVQSSIFLTMAGFEDLTQEVKELSGGWRKRLSLAIAFAQEPDLLIMDEPTNHMDWDGVLWLEEFLSSYQKAFILVSHDRTFLDRICNKTMEINRLYKGGYFSYTGGYKEFLLKREEYLQAQLRLQGSMSNKARREEEWLRAGVKARTTKSQSRQKEAYQLLEDLEVVKSRNRAAQSKIRLEIDVAGKRSKKFIELKKLSVNYDDIYLVRDLDLVLGPNECVGLLGENGSGKTSLLKVLAKKSESYQGGAFWADGLKVIYFDQKREDLPQDSDLMEFLGDGSDYLIFKGESVHVASYASRFLFSPEKMKLKISQLSGGEQARLLIARLLLQSADVFILDEPTNDLDIESIEILEETLSTFDGLVIVVSHDRYFLSKICDRYIALDGRGGWVAYPDLDQWLRDRRNDKEGGHPEFKRDAKNTSTLDAGKKSAEEQISAPKNKVKLSYKEKKQLETIEQDIEKAEVQISKIQKELESKECLSDREKMQKCLAMMEEQQAKIDELYELWKKAEGLE